jgi:hypothetical protein
MSKPSRRAFLKTSAALAAGTAVLRNAPAFAAPTAATTTATPLTQFDYHEIQLLDGPMLVQFQQNHALFLNLNEDSILKPFRQLTGMPAPGEDLGGWYSPSSLFDPPKNMTGYVPGHTFGQWLSGLSRAYAITGDKPTQAKVQRLVAGFAPTVSQKFYVDYCIPAYTFDKTNCGLIDAHQFAGDPQALAVLNRATDAVLPFLPAKALLSRLPARSRCALSPARAALPRGRHLLWSALREHQHASRPTRLQPRQRPLLRHAVLPHRRQ